MGWSKTNLNGLCAHALGRGKQGIEIVLGNLENHSGGVLGLEPTPEIRRKRRASRANHSATHNATLHAHYGAIRHFFVVQVIVRLAINGYFRVVVIRELVAFLITPKLIVQKECSNLSASALNGHLKFLQKTEMLWSKVREIRAKSNANVAQKIHANLQQIRLNHMQ
jgi:hypothetical protein